MTPADMAPSVDVSIVVATFNRAPKLRQLLESLVLLPDRGPTYEVIVADNGSTDDTCAVVEQAAARGPSRVRYLREDQPGVSSARNAGARAATAPIVALLDDDEEIAPQWLEAIARVFREHPEVDVIGGPVRPRWHHPPPAWITPSLLGPVSIIDRGDAPFRITRQRWMCLPGGNMAWRRRALLDLGGFSPAYPRSQDREITVRALLAGLGAMYVPDMVVCHHVDGQRMTKPFFRRWSRMEGRMRAGYAFEELFTAEGYLRPLEDGSPRILGVSRFVYREWIEAARASVGATIRGRRDEAFRHELRCLYLAAYIEQRIDATGDGAASLPYRTGAVVARGVARVAALLGGIVH